MCKKERVCSEILSKQYFIIKRVQELGIKKNYIGFYYLVEIMNLLINEEAKIRSFSREVYPELARKYNKNGCTVERDIRSVIDKFWNKELKNKLTLFWNKDNAPSCCKFIYIIKNYLVMQIA